MKLSILFLLLALPFVVSAQDIQWKKDAPLTWADFKGKPNEDRSAGATTYSRISYSAHREGPDTPYRFTFTVRCLFNSDRSWVKNEYKGPRVLMHEQLHFDISELYARMLYDALTKAVYTDNWRAEMHKIYTDIDNARKIVQQKYDAQVSNRTIEVQESWNQYIHDALVRLPANY